MRKRDELTVPTSCMNRAKDDEMTFVLLGRDVAAPAAIHAWVTERIRLGKNKPQDAQIQEALNCAFTMIESAGGTAQPDALDFLQPNGEFITRQRCCNNGFAGEQHDCCKQPAAPHVESAEQFAKELVQILYDTNPPRSIAERYTVDAIKAYARQLREDAKFIAEVDGEC